MDWSALTEHADEGSYARGEDYARRGLVEIVSATPTRIRAEAHGSTTYDVVLEQSSWSCSCPVGVNGWFCKHLVATALLASGNGEPAEGPASTGATGFDDITTWLADLDADSLAEVAEVLVDRHPEVMDTLAVLRARTTGDLSVLVDLVESLRTRRHLDWRAADEHGEHAHEVADELEQALSPATAGALLPLLEKAIDILVRVISRSDDSSGIQGGATRRLLDLHGQAAVLAPPEPKRLARWMVRTTCDPDGFLDVDVVRYAPALGEKGLAAYRRELAKVLDKKPDDWSGQRALLRLAVLSGDVDEIVRLAGGPLDNVYRYGAVVDALREAGHDDEALRYALAGTELPPSFQQSPRLFDAAADILGARGDHAEVLRQRTRQLEQLPTGPSYTSLRRAAEAIGTWDVERLSALDVLLERSPRTWLSVLLDEGEVELAWNAAADLPLDSALLLRLARERAKTHPAEVFDAYATLVEELLRVADQRNYRLAVSHLGELRRACAAAGQHDRFAALVDELLQTHRRRPTLVAMLVRLR